MKNVYNHFICVAQNILDLLSNKTVAAKKCYLWCALKLVLPMENN